VKRAIASYRVLGPPGPRRQDRLFSDRSVSHESWYVDTANSVVAALWQGGELWLAGDAVHVIAGGVAVSLTPRDEAPPGVAASACSRWVKVTPEIGSRYVALTGAAREGVEEVALVVDVVADPPPEDLSRWLAVLQEREVDLSWMGNEGGPGLVHAIRRSMAGQSSVRAALLDHAREDAELTQLVRESAEVWLESSDEPPIEAGRLVAEDPTRGWVEDLELDAIISNIRGTAGAWLDPGTAHARSVWRCVLSGAAILEALRNYVEQPTIVAVHSAPVDSVVCVHLIGGIDRSSGDLVGFARQRVWT
jgi:hypothetical protein